MAMAMPKVSGCEMQDCSYNRSRECHAMAITVGEASHPMCDTLNKVAQKGGVADMTGGVGACKVDACKYNASFECTAPDIRVGMHEGHADCMTFMRK